MKDKNLVSMPKSKFFKIACKKCKNEQVTFSKPATVVKCLNCGEELVVPTGGEAFVKGKKLMTLT